MTDWISVKDRLPDFGTKVLTYSKFGHISDRILNKHVNANGAELLFFSPDGMQPGRDITHWMPLPEPPKEGNDD